MPKTKSEPAHEVWIVATRADVGRFFKVNRSTVGEWVSAGMPGQPGHYDLSEILAWKQNRARDAAANCANGASGPAVELRLKKHAVDLLIAERQAALLKQKLELGAGDLIDSRDVSQRWNAGLLRVKNRLESIADEMATTFPRKTRPQNVADVRRFIENLLREMSQWRPHDDAPMEVAGHA